MVLTEEKGNLFELDSKYYLAHCISSDYALGAGIAVYFNKLFGLKPILNKVGNKVYPDCILIDRVFNLVTKNKYWNKPTYENLEEALRLMKTKVEQLNIQYLAMPKIGCGLDKLQWEPVRRMIERTFEDLDIEIVVRYL